MVSVPGESGETEPVDGSHRVQGPDSDLMDGETEGDTVVIAGQPEVLSTQAMQVRYQCFSILLSNFYFYIKMIIHKNSFKELETFVLAVRYLIADAEFVQNILFYVG